MSRPSTNRDVQRVAFVESLHTSLKKQTNKAIADHKKFIILASSYIDDGLEESECIELMMIDGLSRDAAEGYISMAQSNKDNVQEDAAEYSFQFEDNNGAIWSSYDIGKIVKASDDDDAWIKAEEAIANESIIDAHRLLSVSRI
jgi:hypothetical protein